MPAIEGDVPQIRFAIATLLMAARIIATPRGAALDEDATREQMARAAIADADELLRRVIPI